MALRNGVHTMKSVDTLKTKTHCTGCHTILQLGPLIKHEYQKRCVQGMKHGWQYDIKFALDYRDCGYYCVLCDVENRPYKLERMGK